MKTLLLAAGLAVSLQFQNNPDWYERPTQVTCIDGYVRMVDGRVIWQNDRLVSAHATQESIVFTPDGVGFRMNGDFHLNGDGKLLKGYAVTEHYFFSPDGISVPVQGFVELNSSSRIVKCELSRITSLFTSDGISRQFISFVQFNSSGRVTAGKLAAESIFFRPDGTAITIAANKIVFLDTNSRLLYTRSSWSSEGEFEINKML